MTYDYLIVGSGLYGATFAHFAKKAGKRCLVIDKRPHLGGNLYCENIEGIHVHSYGAHIFHTSNREVWDFVNSIVPFNRYTNCPVANYHGELYNLPFNMNTFCQMWPDVHTPVESKARIEEQKAEALAALNGREPQNLEEQALCLVGRDIFTKLIKEYTEKQWGRDCKDLPAFIIRRLPVRFVFDNNYFNDCYQGIPIGGYNKLIDGLLEGTDTLCNCDYFSTTIEDLLGLAKICFKEKETNPSKSEQINIYENLRSINGNLCLRDCWRQMADNLIYCGPLDQYFDYSLGHLDWRTVTFKTRVEETANYQGNAVINYTSHEQPYTRVIEHKHFEMFGADIDTCPKTVISEEYSTEYKEGMEKYYPVNDDKNNTLADQYRALAAQEKNVIFGGRLAEYKYYDMAPIIEKVMKYWK